MNDAKNLLKTKQQALKSTHSARENNHCWYWRRERNKNRTAAKTLHAHTRDERRGRKQHTALGAPRAHKTSQGEKRQQPIGLAPVHNKSKMLLLLLLLLRLLFVNRFSSLLLLVRVVRMRAFVVSMLSSTRIREAPTPFFISVCAPVHRWVCLRAARASENDFCFIFMSTKVRAGLIFSCALLLLCCVYTSRANGSRNWSDPSVLCVRDARIQAHTQRGAHTHAVSAHSHTGHGTTSPKYTWIRVYFIAHAHDWKFLVDDSVLKRPSEPQQRRQLHQSEHVFGWLPHKQRRYRLWAAQFQRFH